MPSIEKRLNRRLYSRQCKMKRFERNITILNLDTTKTSETLLVYCSLSYANAKNCTKTQNSSSLETMKPALLVCFQFI